MRWPGAQNSLLDVSQQSPYSPQWHAAVNICVQASGENVFHFLFKHARLSFNKKEKKFLTNTCMIELTGLNSSFPPNLTSNFQVVASMA